MRLDLATRPRGRRRHRCRRDERGATLIEAAFVAPAFLVVLFLIIEGAFFIRADLAVARSAVEGARSASVAANNANADAKALAAIKIALGGLDAQRVQRVVVYRASRANAAVPTGCRSQSIAGVCNRYAAADLDRPMSDFGCAPSSPDRAWCPTIRKVGASIGADGPADFIGVEVSYRHRGLTGLFFSSMTLTRRGVTRIEVQTL